MFGILLHKEQCILDIDEPALKMVVYAPHSVKRGGKPLCVIGHLLLVQRSGVLNCDKQIGKGAKPGVQQRQGLIADLFLLFQGVIRVETQSEIGKITVFPGKI